MEISSNGSKLSWWLLGIFATLFLLSISFFINTMVQINTRLGSIEVTEATLVEKVKHLENSVQLMSGDKLEVMIKNSELSNKVSSVENVIKVIESRLASMYERLLTASDRRQPQ